MRMMFQMINAEAHCTGREVRKIGNDGHHVVPAFAPEYEVVSCIVNDHVIGMVSERADAISDEKTEPPITESQFAHSIRDRRLYEHQRHSDQRRVRIAHHQLANLRMRFYDRSRTAWMRLVEFRLIKRGLHRFNITINEPPNRLFSSRQSEARLTRIESALIRPRSETKEAAAKPLPLHHLTDRKNLKSLFQPDVPEPAFDGSKRLVVAVLERASHERRIFIGHILDPKRESRAIQPGAPSTGIILSRGDRHDVFLLALHLHVLPAIFGKTRHRRLRRGRRQIERVRCDQIERGPRRHFARAPRKRTTPRILELCRSCQTDIVVLVLTGPVDDRANINSSQPRVGRAIVEQTEIGSIPWDRTG